MKIYYDVTKEQSSRHISGLIRVSRRLFGELVALPGIEATAVTWNLKKHCLLDARSSRTLKPVSGVYYVNPELFSEDERPGFIQFLKDAPMHKLAIYHDAIPLKFPEFTWPHSIQRHPAYMKSLALFDRVVAVSRQSRRELEQYWHWLGIDDTPRTSQITLGADFLSMKPQTPVDTSEMKRKVLAVGIVEPRKNQTLLLDTCERLWQDGERFELVIAGRANPHFAKPILKTIHAMVKAGHPVIYHKTIVDNALWMLYRSAYFSVFPSRFEGCGLPVQESLWAGTPCICTDIPALRECTSDGGCLEFRNNDGASLYTEMKRLLTDEACHGRLCEEIARRTLPTWRSAAQQLVATLLATSGQQSPSAG